MRTEVGVSVKTSRAKSVHPPSAVITPSTRDEGRRSAAQGRLTRIRGFEDVEWRVRVGPPGVMWDVFGLESGSELSDPVSGQVCMPTIARTATAATDVLPTTRRIVRRRRIRRRIDRVASAGASIGHAAAFRSVVRGSMSVIAMLLADRGRDVGGGCCGGRGGVGAGIRAQTLT